MLGFGLMLCYPFQTLFSGNQNVYFLWGLAKAGVSSLHLDPLLNQADPFPLFSGLIFVIWKFLHPAVSYILYGLLNTVYTYAIFGIVDHVFGIYRKQGHLLWFIPLFLFIHSSELWGSFLRILIGVDLVWIWDSGIAEQGVLRGYLQPSAFGVFLILSVYHYLRNSPKWTFLTLGVAAVFHANYIFLGGIMGCVFLLDFIRHDLRKRALMWAFGSALLVLPYVFYTALNFLPDSGSEQQILNGAVALTKANNPHLDLALWRTLKTGLQLAVIVMFLFMFSKNRLGKLFNALVAIGVTLTVVAFWSNSSILLSLNPWRITTVILPVAASILIWKLAVSKYGKSILPIISTTSVVALTSLIAYRIFGNVEIESIWRVASGNLIVISILLSYFFFKSKYYLSMKPLFAYGLIFATISSGIFGVLIENRFKSSSAESGLVAFAKNHRSEPSVYLVPSDMTTFRMETGNAIIADNNLVFGKGLGNQLKRIEITKEFYEQDWGDETQIIQTMETQRANRVVIPAQKNLPELSELTELYRDENFVVLSID